jgi:cytochrome P450
MSTEVMPPAEGESGAPDGRPRVQFDHHSDEFARDPWSVYAAARSECPVAWNDAYGGFWVLSKYEDIKQVALDDHTFSSADTIVIPPKLINRRAIPIESDPPEFYEYRRIMNPVLSPAAIEKIEPAIQEFITRCIDEFIERGSCDIVTELADPVPAMTTLYLLGLPVEEWRLFSEPLHATVFHRQDNPIRKEALPLYRRMHEIIVEAIAERHRTPRNDGISRLMTGEVQGRQITDEEVIEMTELILSGGIDTTGSAIGNALLYLDQNHAARAHLIEHPEAIPQAVEEFLRYEAPQQGLARTAKKDCAIGGQHVKAGERIFLLWASGNRDDDAFPDPDEVVLDRFPNRHMTFGLGAHRCLGSTVARKQIVHSLTAVLNRLPDFVVDRPRVTHAETIGVVYGHFSIPLTFTPGSRLLPKGPPLR